MRGIVSVVRIYSWNVKFDNHRLDKAVDFIRTSAWDVFCLQEVPEEQLAALSALPYHFAATSEMDRRLRRTIITTYLVTLSRHPIESVRKPPLPYRDPELPLRVRLVATITVWLGILGFAQGNRHALIADIRTEYGVIRVFNLHLPLLNPDMRAEDFELALAERSGTFPSVVCGDFNTLESSRVTVINFLLGGSLADAFLLKRERAFMERRFAHYYGLVNPLRGRSTHEISHSQLDHILVPQSWHVERAHVMHNRFHSDHNPVFLDVVPSDSTSAGAHPATS